jgi:hypothetical protein
MDEDFQDRIQRILNEKKKEDLREQYGAHFSEGEEKLPPEVEGEWLDNIAEFERQFESAKSITVREKIGNPSVRPLPEIPETELGVELENLLDLLLQHNIVVDFIHDQEDREVYRFVTEELLDAETSDMLIPDFFSHFIYEEFHPNDVDDITQFTEEFLHGLFDEEFRDPNNMWYHTVSREHMRDSAGNPISLEHFKKLAADFYEAYPAITDHKYEVTKVMVDGDTATAEARVTWRAMPKDKSAIVSHEGISTFKLERCQYGGWDVTQANIVGWDFS